MEKKSKIPFTMENIKKCICSTCPVQEKSECAKKKMEMGKAMMENPDMSDMMPTTEDVPGVYCANGAAVCKDIDTTQMCVCGNCPVWEEYNLSGEKPMGYYCRDGKVE